MQTLEDIRKHLHQFPELSGQEYETQRFLKKELKRLQPNYLKKVASTGLLVGFWAEEEGPSILLRADIDALPIPEINTFDHRSRKEKESHKCGHDGHATILLGVARQLAQQPLKRGRVFLLFQPAEETGQGAQAVLNDPEFRKWSFKQCFALHNLPGYPLHQIICKPQQFSAGAVSVAFRFFGKTAHAAQPEKGINPSKALSAILQLSEAYTHKKTESEDFALITPIYVTMGEKSYGVSAGYAEAHFTLRAWSQDRLQFLGDTFSEAVRDQAKAEGLLVEEEWFEAFHAVVNEPAAYELVRNSAEALTYNWHELPKPFKWTEDFGLFSSIFTGAMFGLGAGEETPSLHNPDYDFPDEILETGVNLFVEIVNQALRADH